MPADFHYPLLPAAAPTSKTVQLPLPIRIVCGSDQPVGKFTPDPNMVEGEENSADSPIDTGVPNAAPAAVYQSERYGNDFTYAFQMPEDQSYLVRLHFAEVFDNGAGIRRENIYINGSQVLANLDIFSLAGGMNKALVKEFRNIGPIARVISPFALPLRRTARIKMPRSAQLKS
jgi:hypothetical protein